MHCLGIEKEVSDVLNPLEVKPLDDENEQETWKQDEEEDKEDNIANQNEEYKEDDDSKKTVKKSNKVHTESMIKDNIHYKDETMGELDYLNFS